MNSLDEFGEREIDPRVVRRYLRERARREARESHVKSPDRLWYPDPVGDEAVAALEPWLRQKKALRKFPLPEGQMTETPNAMKGKRS